MAVTYLNESQHSFLRATTDLEWTQDPPGLPVLSWGVQWRRAWAGALDLARAQSLPLWNGSESLEKRHPRTQRNRQTRQGDKEVSLSQACSSAKANKMQDHEYAFAREHREKDLGGSWVLPPSAASPSYHVSFKPRCAKILKDRQTDFSSSPARGGAPTLLIIVLKCPKDS